MPEPRVVLEVQTPQGWEVAGHVALDANLEALAKLRLGASVFRHVLSIYAPTPMATQLWRTLHPGEETPWARDRARALPPLALTLAELEQLPDDCGGERLTRVILDLQGLAAQRGLAADAVRLMMAFDGEEPHAD